MPGCRSHRALQHDVVEADDDDPVGRARGFEQLRHAVDGEVRPLGLLDLEHDAHRLSRRPVERLRKRRNAGSGEAGMKADARIEAADALEAKVRCEARAVGRPVEGQVMQDDRFAVGGQHDVDLDGRRARGLGRLKGRQRVLRIVQAVAAVAADMNPPGLGGKETERHGRAGSSLGCGDQVVCSDRRGPLTVPRTTRSTGKWTEIGGRPGSASRRSRMATTSRAMRAGSCRSVVSA